jgi:hypothetical protein
VKGESVFPENCGDWLSDRGFPLLEYRQSCDSERGHVFRDVGFHVSGERVFLYPDCVGSTF